ncbi:hypothetical protein OG890_23550 [Streptomyces anulatus]|uniref:hypothetical protein n=1 Tax=Streptomyces anulatus TaxID=1892 RepID=UPI0022547BDD|nr:hypothetical protein [Streptomyces anulatus]MCX4486872.1 hypothetical protein [Streptomyces anulatus]MCX4502441.1 hypothetical protein [Streptomyces anulatus]WTD14331.1 hypothetical protein OHA54_36025 [Streptomyces anulatus]WTE07642.1 hypothetical protein OH765_36130 [Streptomyces anulatus]
MNKLRSALATAAAAGLGLAALATAPVQAAAQPAFLAAAQMPPSSTSWTATQVFTGVPENGGVLCAPYKIPAQNTRYREFSTELDTNGVQVTTVARTEADAVKLVDTLRGALAGCGSLLEQQNPGLQAVSASHGKLAVEEGAWVYSLDTSDPQIGISDIHLFSVGRDGRTVTLVRWGQMGDLEDAPLAAFRTTTKTAVNKLH